MRRSALFCRDGRLDFELNPTRSKSWWEYFELLGEMQIPDDFLAEREDTKPQERDGLSSLAECNDRSGYDKAPAKECRPAKRD